MAPGFGGGGLSPALAASAMLAGMIPENPGGDADGNYWLLAGVAPAAFWTVVLVVSQKPGPAATASNMRIPICGCLALAAVFAIAAVGHDSLIMLHNDDFKVTINHGLWRESTAYNGETIAQVDNNCGLDYGQPGPDDGSDCSDALNAKCKTSKVFAIIGITSNVFAFLPLFVAPMRDGVGVAATGLASLSYLIIFAIAASFYNGDAPPVVVAGVVVGAGDKTSSCGSGLSEIEDYGFGASFFLFITAWILTAGASILGLVAIFLASPTPSDGGDSKFGVFQVEDRAVANPVYGAGDWKVGDRVVVDGKGAGTVAFVGDHHVEGTPRVGVNLDGSYGKNNGTVKGHTYFTCEDNHGSLVKLDKLSAE